MANAHSLDVPGAPHQVYADLLSQAITGELVGMLNYATLAGLFPDTEGQISAVRHAAAELRHAEIFRQAGKDCGFVPIVNPGALHWAKIRSTFLRHAGEGDLVACLIIQEIMLESMAVALYAELGTVPEERIARVFAATAREEAAHVDDGRGRLALAAQRDPAGFHDKVEQIHDEVMGAIAAMLAGEEEGENEHCGLCAGTCVKQALPAVGLDRGRMRSRAMRAYLEALDSLSVPGDRSLAWVARLPL